ncbi:MAG: hypothetical protein R3D28_06970 [Geminicoccaceae bacterium]
MKYTLPTLHVLYFGIQAKKGKLDSAGVGKDGSANVAEIHNQVNMMLGHEIFDPELNRRVLVDHAFIVAGGEITKQARNWIGNKSTPSNGLRLCSWTETIFSTVHRDEHTAAKAARFHHRRQ